jgi:hypothetical protein
MTEKPGFMPRRTPTPGESLWGKRFAAIAATLAVAGVIVGGSASAVFLLAAMGCLLVFGYCFRATADPGFSGPC